MDMWRTARQLLYVGLIILVALVGIVLSVLMIGGSKLLSVQSGSMEPNIQKGDLISVERTPTRELRVGDVVTYTDRDNGNQMITHRIVAMTGDMSGRIVTQGDANNRADQAILPSQIVGRVNHNLPLLGHLIDFIKTPLGLLLIIYLPALLLVVSEIKRLAHYYRQNQPYRMQGR